MEKLFEKFVEVATGIIGTVCLLVIIGVVLWCTAGALREMAAPLPPLVTAALALFFTFCTFSRWKTGIPAIIGIVIYVASWPTAQTFGVLAGMYVWAIGCFIWGTTVYRSLSYLMTPEARV